MGLCLCANLGHLRSNIKCLVVVTAFWKETRYSVQWNYIVHCSFKTLGCYCSFKTLWCYCSFKTLFVSFKTLDQMNSSLTVERLKLMFSVCHLYLEAWTFLRPFLWFWISIFNSFLGMTILYDKEIFFRFFHFIYFIKI